MSQQRTPFSIAAPGFQGLNLQDSPVGMESTFALVANNCVIDKSGRIASRMGYDRLNASNAQLSTSDISCIGEVTENSGTTTVVAAGGGYVFKYASGTLTTLTYGGAGVDPTPTASNNWQFCQMAGVGMFWQRGFDPLIYDPTVSTTTFRRLNEKTGTLGTIQQANTAISAYGRVWAADLTANKNTVYWSDTLTPHIWSGGTSGSLNLLGVWPKGGDEIIALAAHNNFLVIFGKKQTLIYSGADTPSTMTLSDALSVGCIARDSVQVTGDDIIFLSDSGVRSLMRTIQEKSAPLREISANVRDSLQTDVVAETLANVRSVYSPTQAFYLLTMPASDKTYCFDVRTFQANGAARVTTWALEPKALYYTSTRLLYMGFAGYVCNYAGYLDHTSTYVFSYYTPWIDFGNPIQTSILKDIVLTMIGQGSQTITFKWAYDFVESYFSSSATVTGNTVSRYGTATYGNSTYGAATAVNVASVNGSSSGQVLQTGFETVINDTSFSIQKIDIFCKEGRI